MNDRLINQVQIRDAAAILATRKPKFIIGPRPGKKSVATLKSYNLTHCCTLLSKREQARSIEKICQTLDCHWIWLPLDGGRLDILRNVDLAGYVARLTDEVAKTTEDPCIYFHCSAGIHRTGFFVYVLLRLQGLSTEQARTALANLRAVTAEQVGPDRLALADEMIASLDAR